MRECSHDFGIEGVRAERSEEGGCADYAGVRGPVIEAAAVGEFCEEEVE